MFREHAKARAPNPARLDRDIIRGMCGHVSSINSGPPTMRRLGPYGLIIGAMWPETQESTPSR
jgi:hypothetical protein